MSQILISTFDVPDLSAAALAILNAAVRHAHENQQVKMHTIAIADFCRLAGLPATTTERFLALLKEARKALVVVDVIDTTLPGRDDLPGSSWPVFNEIKIDGSNVSFNVCSYTFAEFVLASLPASRMVSATSIR